MAYIMSLGSPTLTPPKSIAVKADGNNFFNGLSAQVQVCSTLDNPEKGMFRIGFGHAALPGPSEW